jgi:hypothetical protein
MSGLVLELEVDLTLDDDNEDAYKAYLADGMSEDAAALREAQDLLGNTGALVQHAEAVPA